MKNEETFLYVRKIIGENVSRLREDASITQKEFASMISADRSYINKFENAKANLSIDMLTKISNGLGIPITELVVGLEDMKPYKFSEEPTETQYGVVDLPKE